MFVPSFEALAASEVLLSARSVSSRASPLVSDVLRFLASLLHVSDLNLRLACVVSEVFSKGSYSLLSRRNPKNNIIATPKQRVSIRFCSVMVEINLVDLYFGWIERKSCSNEMGMIRKAFVIGYAHWGRSNRDPIASDKRTLPQGNCILAACICGKR